MNWNDFVGIGVFVTVTSNVQVIEYNRFASYAVIAIMLSTLSLIIAMTGVLKWKW